MNNPKILSTANPNGVTVKHILPFNPTGQAVFKNGMYLTKFENIPIGDFENVSENLLDQAKELITPNAKRR